MAVNDLASGGTVHGPQTVEQLFAGDAPIVTGKGTSAAAITKYQVVKLTTTGTLDPDLSAVTNGEKCVIAAQAAGGAGVAVPFYSAGYFNHAVLGWPGALSTLALRKEFFAGTSIHIGDLALG